MQPAESLDDYLRAPLGRYFAGEGLLHWYASAELCGFILWGRPGEATARRLVRVLDVELPPAPPHVSLVDVSRLEGTDPESFMLLVKYMQRHEQQFRQSVRRQAMVRPEGLIGAVSGGFYSLLAGPWPHKVCREASEALGWLGVAQATAAPLLEWLGERVAEAQGQSPLLRELHGVLRGRLADASLAEVARELGLSERTLQRRLKEAGTSFQAELNTVQVRTAQALLLETDMKLTAVAAEVGCASLQHFSSLFRKRVGASPSTWREQRRGGAAEGDS